MTTVVTEKAEVTTTPETEPKVEAPKDADQKAADQMYGDKPEEKQTTKPDEKETEEKKEVSLDLKLPEKSFLTPSYIEKVKDLAIKSGLSQDQAQARLEQDNALVTEVINDPDVLKFHVEQAKAEWKKQAESDKEIGGDKLGASIELAQLALNHPSLKSDVMIQLMNNTEWGSHPEVIRLLSRIGKLFKEDAVHKGQVNPPPKNLQPWERMYGAKQN